MSRSGYSDDCDGWDLIRWRGAVASAIRGKRGQAFLREMRDALDSMPEKCLAESVLVRGDGACCAMGAVAIKRGLATDDIDPYDREQVSGALGIAEALAAEIAFMNDGDYRYRSFEPRERWTYMRKWVEKQIKDPTP